MYRQSEKNLLSSNISSTCPHNMVNFGPLAAEIVSLVWGTPGNFNGFRVLAALLHRTLVVGVSQTAALNRGRHLYSAGRPSRWALAHISSFHYRHGPQSGRRAAVPLTVGGGAGSTSNTMSPGPRPTSVPSGTLMHPTIHQRYRQTDRTMVP